MNRHVFTLLTDYYRRTLGVWLLLVFVQLMQMSTIWVFGSTRLPILGAVIAALAFCTTWDSPHVVIRTLPITARDLALLRWWENIGMPMPFITLAFVLSWLANDGSHFPTPSLLSLWVPVLGSLATLGILSVLPLPMLSETRSNALIVLVWIALVVAALFGLPMDALPAPVPEALLAGGLLLALISFGLARSGRVLQLPPLSRFIAGWRAPRQWLSLAGPHLRGWPVLVAPWVRSTILMALVSVVAISFVRPHVHFFQQALPWIFVSVTGAVGTILGRRWLLSVPALLCLPIREGTLALIVCFALMAPVVVTSVVATAVNALVPGWGIAVPLYMAPVFAIVPAFKMSWQGGMESTHPVPSAIQRWTPTLQLAAWPLWTGPFMSLELTRLMPAWFDLIAVGAAAVLAVVAYHTAFSRIRSGVGFERMGDPLAPR